MSRCLVAMLAGCMMTLPVEVTAQATPAYDPLGIPGDAMMLCREAFPTASHSDHGVSVIVDFSDFLPSQYDREIGAFYDSTGRIILLAVRASELGNEPKHKWHTVVARFDSSGPRVRFAGETEVPSSELSLSDSSTNRTPAPPLPIPLTDAEITRAKELAVWLWDGHCGRRARERAGLKISEPSQ